MTTLTCGGPRPRRFGVIGPAARAAVPPLRLAPRDADSAVRRSAAEALGRIGRDAKDAVPTLLELQADGAPPVRRAATQALVRIVTASSPDYRDGRTLSAIQAQG